MSGPVPMSPSTAPDSTVSQGSAASAPAGMVSGNDGAVNAGQHLCTTWEILYKEVVTHGQAQHLG